MSDVQHKLSAAERVAASLRSRIGDAPQALREVLRQELQNVEREIADLRAQLSGVRHE